MTWQFDKHYTVEEARTLLPSVRRWLEQLTRLRNQLQALEQKHSPALAAGDDLGGPAVNRLIATLASLRGVISEFEAREIQIKDLDRGLVDFPAFVGGREVFLCWEKDEDDIEFWHDLESGFAGRERL